MKKATMTVENKIIIGASIIVALLVCLLSLVYFQLGPFAQGRTDKGLLQEDYAVYSALINARYIHDNVELLIIYEYTSTEGISDTGGMRKTLKYVKSKMSGLSRKTVNNFKTRNGQVRLLKNLFNVNVKYVLISSGEREEVFRYGMRWDKFYEKYPNSSGIMRLSRVGFNNKMKQALVYVGKQQHGLSGSGVFYLLTKKNNVWTVKAELPVWIS